MKKYLLFIVLAFFGIMCASAQKQSKQSKAEMIKELHEFKMKFLAQEIELKDNQKQKFFEVYSKKSEEKHKIFKDARAAEKKIKKDKNATDADYEAACVAMTKAREMDAAIDKKYDAEFATFLTPKQIYKLRDAEEKFRKKMHEMKKKKKKD